MSKVLFLNLLLIVLSIQGQPQSPQCPQGHLPFQGACKPIRYAEGCATYHPDNQCRACEYGYELNSGKCHSNCNQTADCCASYSSDGTCLQCSNGLFSSDPYCYRNEIYGCILKQANKCLVCGYELALYNGLCITPILQCASYNDEGICSACKTHNKLINNYCYPFPQMPNCQSHNEYGCIQCASGYFLSSKKTCQQYEPGCLQYWQEKCIACLPAFTLHQYKCFISGCKAYNKDSCAQCYDGYSLNSGKCQVNGCVRVINNTCVQCRDGLRLSAKGCVSPVDYQCTSCAEGFKFVSGACVKIIFGCVSYKNYKQCSQCQTPFQLTINGECQILGCYKYCQQGCLQCTPPFQLHNNICLIQNCQKYGVDGCSNCKSGFMLAGGRCYPKDPNCLQYSLVNNQPVCQKCVQKYYPQGLICKPAERGCIYDSQGICKCKNGFWLKNGECELIGCNKYDWQTCLSCYSPFQYNSQTQSCTIPYCVAYNWSNCKNCQEGWLLKDGICIKGDPYCISYCSSGSCQACKQGFMLSGDKKCIRNIPYCSQFSSDYLSCLKCQNGYQLFNSYCKRIIPNCRQMDFQNDVCTCCQQDYHLSNGQCASNDKNCLTYTKKGNHEYCSECRDWFFYDPSQNICKQKQPGCVYDGCNCVSCIQPFSYNSQKGQCFIPGCQKYNYEGCINCISPFFLVDKYCKINNCLDYSTDACVKCQRGFSVTNQGLCVPIDPNCLAYEGSFCIKCKEGFIIFEGKCVVKDQYCVQYDQNGVVCKTCNPRYHPDCNGRCQPNQPGCKYQNGICIACSSPFVYNLRLKSCEIQNCQEANSQGCFKCKAPFKLSQDKTCTLDNCVRWTCDGCTQCKPLYHLRSGECVPNNPNCQYYNPSSGVCQLCRNKFTLDSKGECIQGSNACSQYCKQDRSKCLGCNSGYFLNRYYQCEKEDGKCQAYTNGVCSKCTDKFFLYSDICFPYTKGCVQYSGKDCTHCRNGYVLKNGECFSWEPKGMALLGGDDRYDFEINPIDVRQSKYYINNLSPASAIGQFYFSSYQDNTYQDCSLSTLEGTISKGWRSKVSDSNQYIGVILSDQPATFYALQLEAVDGNYITEFYLEYSVDGVEFIRVQNPFSVASSVANNMTTIYFTGIYAKSIRIRISGYQGWPACHIDFFYYDLIRFRKISNLKSLTYLQETIDSNFVDRVDNQIYINQIYFFNPAAECTIKEMCFTGLQLCEPRTITGLTLTFDDPNSFVTQFYLTFSVDGRNYNCYQKCQTYKINKCSNNSFSMKMGDLKAQGMRVYPKNYQGSPKFSPTFYYH